MITMDTIIQDPNSLLRQKSQPVSLPLSQEDKHLVNDLVEYVMNSRDEQLAQEYNLQPAVGIAAPQIGVLKRICVVVVDDETPQGEPIVHQYALVNPILLSFSQKEVALKNGEGCLSIREQHEGLVYRSHKIKVKAFDALTNQEIIIQATGYLAIVIQHELDHLNGVLFYDHINPNNPWEEKPRAILI